MQDVLKTVISQYGNSPIILAIIRSMDRAIDPRPDWDNFWNMVWNVDTAQGFGLDIWGRIVVIGRGLRIPAPEDWLGFDPAWSPFGEAPFWNGVIAEGIVLLTDDAYRKLILIKAAANISGTNAPALNSLLCRLFEGRGIIFVNDYLNMTMRYVFLFDLTPAEISILQYSGTMPRPAGVLINGFAAAPPFLGFAGMTEAGTFGNAPFVSPTAFFTIS